tara:strand:- start:226 stop:624 length:399 start_codon:yes stop_codon:yes gene_type:complete
MRYDYPSGSYYEGNIIDDTFDGMGILYFNNGDIYEGQFKNDMFEGKGMYKYKSGAKYNGLFSNDKFHGIGTLLFEDGTIEKGKFHEDKRVGKFYQIENHEMYEIVYQNDNLLKYNKVDSIPENKVPCMDDFS